MRRFLLATPIAAILLFSASALAQTTGDIVGRVVDEQGGALPGVTVEARGPSFQGVRTSVTDANGVYRLVLLPPGIFKVTADAPGVRPRRGDGHRRARRRPRPADIRLRRRRRGAGRRHRRGPGRRHDLDRPRIQLRQPRDPNCLPTGRNYTSVVQVSPGVTTAELEHRELRQHDRDLRLHGPREQLHHRRRRHQRHRVRRRRARSSTSSSSRRSRSRPAATRPSTGARPAGSSTSSRSPAATSSTATSSATTTPTRCRPRTSTRTTTCTGSRQGFTTSRLWLRPRRVLLEGPPLVLRRLRPRQEHDHQTS